MPHLSEIICPDNQTEIEVYHHTQAVLFCSKAHMYYSLADMNQQ